MQRISKIKHKEERMKDIKEFTKIIKEKRKFYYAFNKEEASGKTLMTQEDLAEKSNVNVATIRNLERDKLDGVKLGTILKLFNALDIKFEIK